MLLIANGCSHTAGAEIDEPRQGESYEKAWPAHLAKRWECDHINLAISGASQARVIRTTFEKVGELLLKKISPKDLFVIILWPGPSRTEVYDKKEKECDLWKGWTPLVAGNDYTGDRSADTLRYFQAWVNLYSSHWANTQTYIETLSLQSYLKSWGIKYFFYRASVTKYVSDDYTKPFKIQIDRKFFPDFDNSDGCFTNLLKHTGFKFIPWSLGHYPEDGHKFFAKFLDRKIGKIYDY